MPSPFPGMDPYREGSLWTTFHFGLAAELVRRLAPLLRPRYLALLVERLLVEEPGDIAVMTSSIYPDSGVVAGYSEPLGIPQAADAAAPLRLATSIPQMVPHVSIEIRDTAQRQLVTAIEILSPTNKRGEGAIDYVAKRRRILLISAHLIEIDLLRSGRRVPMQQPLPEAPYFILLSRAEQRPMSEVWPIRLDQPLPIIPVPLLADDADLALDLQAAFTATYDLLNYDLMIDYRQAPEIPYTP